MCNVSYLAPRTVDTRNFCLGSIGHSCLERWIKEGGLEPGYMRSIAREEFDKYLKNNTVIPRHAGDLDEMRELAASHADAIERTFFDHGLTDLAPASEQKWFAPFPDTLEDAVLVGVLDIYIESEGAVYDMKMSKSAEYMDEDQLCFYSLLGKLSGRKVRKAGFIVPLRDPDVVELAITPFHLRAMRKRVSVALEVIKTASATGDWEIRYNERACGYCPVKTLCSDRRAGVEARG